MQGSHPLPGVCASMHYLPALVGVMPEMRQAGTTECSWCRRSAPQPA
jgi:hypothetical protein